VIPAQSFDRFGASPDRDGDHGPAQWQDVFLSHVEDPTTTFNVNMTGFYGETIEEMILNEVQSGSNTGWDHRTDLYPLARTCTDPGGLKTTRAMSGFGVTRSRHKKAAIIVMAGGGGQSGRWF
jgi:hypothetical protein